MDENNSENRIPEEEAPRRTPRPDAVRRTPQRSAKRRVDIQQTPEPQPTDAAQRPARPQPVDAAQRPVRPQPVDAAQRPTRPQTTDAVQRPVRPQPTDAAQRPARPQPTDAVQRPVRPQPVDAAQRPIRPQPTNAVQRPVRPQPTDAAQRPARTPSGDGERRPPVGSSQVQRMTSADAPVRRTNKKKRLSPSIVVGRVLLVFLTTILVVLFAAFALCSTLVNGPSETVRDKLVLSAMQASATKWLPGLFLDDEVVDEICKRSEQQQPVTVPMGTIPGANTPSTGEDTDTPGTDVTDPPPVVDEWANAIDGMIFKTYTRPTFKAYLLLIKDPSRVFVGTSSDNYQTATVGKNIFDTVARFDAIAGINAGEYLDTGGGGSGAQPLGITYSNGSCVWDDGSWRTFIGFDKNNVLHAVEPLTKAKAEELGIRDGVCFQNGNVLISNDGQQVTLNYSEGNTGLSQRTAIAQRADGTVILLVTDGRSPSSLGANRNDVIDLLVSEGAVVAGMLDGGSSAMMYYEDYYTKYNMDPAGLDEYQLKGLTNRYKSFTLPRTMPTFFLVRRES